MYLLLLKMLSEILAASVDPFSRATSPFLATTAGS
jgi:hypothetical protein